jgi:hypothetical protein
MNKFETKKNKMIAFALLVVLTISATMITFLPLATAAQKTQSTAYLSFRPNPIGVNQTLLINAWVTPQPPATPDFSGTLPRYGYMIYITNPEGHVDTFGPIKSFDDGTTWMTYTPNKIGNWTIEFSWAGDDDLLLAQLENKNLQYNRIRSLHGQHHHFQPTIGVIQ